MMKKVIGTWNVFELIWLLTFSAVAIGITIVLKDSIFGLTVFLTGVLCVVLAAKGNLMSYVFGMYNTIAYAYVAYINGLFGEVGLNLLFYVPMNVIGFIIWRRNMSGSTVIMRKMQPKGMVMVAIISVVGTLATGFGLSLIETQNTPYIDALTTVLSIVATILMVRRFKEQWLVYIVLNVFTVLMWVLRTLDGSEEGLIMIIMWSAYLVNACYGYYNWSKGAKEAIA